MKKIKKILLSLILLVCGSSISQTVTPKKSLPKQKQESNVVIDTTTARLIANDLVSGDVCKAELKLVKSNLSDDDKNNIKAIVKVLPEKLQAKYAAFILKNYNDIEIGLKDVFIEFRDIYERRQIEEKKRELRSEESRKFRYVETNKELLYDDLQKKISKSDFDLILTYSNYNFDYLINNQPAKPSKRLRDCVYNYLENYIRDLLTSGGFDLSLYEILFANFKIKKCKKLLLKFDAEQIGADHEKRWQISNFSYNN